MNYEKILKEVREKGIVEVLCKDFNEYDELFKRTPREWIYIQYKERLDDGRIIAVVIDRSRPEGRRYWNKTIGKMH